MNKKLGLAPIIMGSIIVILGIIGSFISLFIGICVILYGLWNIFVGIQVRNGRSIFLPSTKEQDEKK